MILNKKAVFEPLKEEGADVTVKVEIKVDSKTGGQTLKIKVKETIQQLGTRFKVEE